MVENTHRGANDGADVENDDPFAELARIIGFDPRRNAEQGRAAVEPPTVDAADSFAANDLTLDLERELMGEFGVDEPAVEQSSYIDPARGTEPATQAHAHTVAVPVDGSADADLELDEDWLAGELDIAAMDSVAFDQNFDDFEPAPAEAELRGEQGDMGIEATWSDGPDALDASVASAIANHEAEPAAVADSEPLTEIAVPFEQDALAVGEADGADAAVADLSYGGTEPLVSATTGQESVPVSFPEADAQMAHAAGEVWPEAPSPELSALPAALDEDFGSVEMASLPAAEPHHADPAHPAETAVQPAIVANTAVHSVAPSLEADQSSPPMELTPANDTPGPLADLSSASLQSDEIDGPEDTDPASVDLEAELNALLGNALRPSLPADAPAPSAHAGDADREWMNTSHDWYNQMYIPPVSGEETSPAAVAAPFEGRRVIYAANDHRIAPSMSANDFAEASAPVYDAAVAETGSEADEFLPELDLHAFDAAIENQLAAEEPLESETFEPLDMGESDDEGQSVAKDGHDPYAALAALSAAVQPGRSDGIGRPDVMEMTSQLPGQASRQAELPRAQFEDLDFPDIDTVDVPEQALAIADDLDLPSFEYEQQKRAGADYDDMDEDFSNLLSGLPNVDDTPPAAIEVPPARPRSAADDPAFYTAVAAAAAAAGTVRAATVGQASARSAVEEAEFLVRDDAAGADLGSDESQPAYDPDFDPDAAPPYVAAASRPSAGRGLLVAAVVGGVAILGGIGAFALSFGDGGGAEEPAIVRADVEPVKVKPENPGGATIPNQDNKVYDSVSGNEAAAAPEQGQLLTSAEEPVEMPMGVDDSAEADADIGETGPVAAAPAGQDGEPAESGSLEALPGVAASGVPAAKSEDRIAQAIAEEPVDATMEVAAVAPRKVRTMVVKPDGTLVAREEPASADATPIVSASEGVVDPAVSTVAAADAVGEIRTGTDAAGEPAAAPPSAAAPAPEAQAAPDTAQVQAATDSGTLDTPPPAAPDTAGTSVAEPAEQAPAAQAGVTPNRAPIAPARPADQPVDIVGEVRGQQVAALETAPAPAAAAAGSWSMQIASQPSEEAAQSTYRDLARRYGSVLDGRQAVIVKADVAGKGTFWRVRVPAGDRAAAIRLCESYKAAGGNCFVSK